MAKKTKPKARSKPPRAKPSKVKRPRPTPSPAARRKPHTNVNTQAESYARHKDRAALRQREQSKAGNNIAPIPDVVNQERRAACERDFERFCKTYFPSIFRLPFSRDHLEIIREMERTVIEGGLVPLCMPRGNGKTALCRRLALWAILYGWREYVFLIGADASLANRNLSVIKKELRFNPLLLEDFPAVCWPIRRLEGKSVRAASQHVDGVPTQIVWTDGRLVMPSVEGSPASGAFIDVAGITGQIRGRNELKSDGREVRPDFFCLDDPQTHESAYSVSQVETREQILMADIIEGAAPGEEVCGIIPCTIICKGDLADRLFDKKRHPEFRGRRFKALYALPTNEARWDEYAEVLKSALEEEDETGKVRAFYERHRVELEEGAIVAWPERKKARYVTALQELMELKILNPSVFASEKQGEPIDVNAKPLNELTPAIITSKLSKLERDVVPSDAAALTAFIDVQKNLLYYLVAAWADDFTGSVLDYGTWPDTGRPWFRLSQIDRLALAKATRLTGLEEQLYAGMGILVGELLGREWHSESKAVSRIKLLLIDGNWPESKNVVYQFCRQSPYAANLMPSRGHFYGAKTTPISDKPKKDGVRRGLEWEIPPPIAGRPTRHLHWDSNFWKSHVHARMAAPVGSRGCLSLFGDDSRAHRMLSEHLTSEYPVHVEVPGRAVDEWQQKAGEDNHWWDCLVGSAVAASVLGISLRNVHESTKQKKREYLSLDEMKARARGKR